MSREQRKFLWESRIYELELPLDIQNRITETKKNFWQELDRQKLREECKKVEEWILDPGHTVGRVSQYEKTMVVYWLMKNLVGWIEWDRKNVEKGDNAQYPWNFSISAAVQRVEAKVDFLISRMGFQYSPSPPLGAPKRYFRVPVRVVGRTLLIFYCNLAIGWFGLSRDISSLFACLCFEPP